LSRPGLPVRSTSTDRTVSVVLSQKSCPIYPVLTVRHGCPATVVPSWLHCPIFVSWDLLSCVSCPGVLLLPSLAVLSRFSCYSLLSQHSCPPALLCLRCPVLAVMSRQSCDLCLLQADLSRLTCHCLVPVAMSQMPCPDFPVMVLLPLFALPGSCPSCPVLVVFSSLSCFCPLFSVLAVFFSPQLPSLAVLSRCLIPAVWSKLSDPSFRVPTILYQHSCPHLSRRALSCLLSYPNYPVLSVLFRLTSVDSQRPG
jgi:hypothetical protein